MKNVEEQFYYLLYSTLLANSPVDTGNMINHIKMNDYGDYYKITISAPAKKGDYAKYVNYNRQRSEKERRNYMWVERSIEEVKKIIESGVDYELY